MADVGMRQRTPAYSPYGGQEQEEEEEDYKDHPAPAKSVGLGVLGGAAISALFILIFIYYIEEERWRPDLEMHAKVVAEHKRARETHALLSGMHREAEKHAEKNPHIPTKEELEEEKRMSDLHDFDQHHEDAEPEAVGMFDQLGGQLHDTEIDLQHHMENFWEWDKNKDAFLTHEDFEHMVKLPVSPENFKKLDKNEDGAVSIREFTSGFTLEHAKEPWFHHKYGYVYGDDIPDHYKDAKAGAVRKGTAEHKELLAAGRIHEKVDEHEEHNKLVGEVMKGHEHLLSDDPKHHAEAAAGVDLSHDAAGHDSHMGAAMAEHDAKDANDHVVHDNHDDSEHH